MRRQHLLTLLDATMNTSSAFDHIIDRRHMPGEKWGRYAGQDILPLWVADMDFAAPDAILQALRQRIEHGVFGYTDPWPSLIEAVVDGVQRDHGWQIQPDWLVWLPGVVSGFNLACRLLEQPGADVLTATPVYPPFLGAPHNHNHNLITTALQVREADQYWIWDRPATEQAITPNTRLLLLCNPHNPVGRVLDRDELAWLAGLAERHDFLICSDEIHCGLVLDEHRQHIPIAALDPVVADRTITLMAPSKTWNIPALYSAFAIIPNTTLRKRFQRAMRGLVGASPNVLGLVATEAAYREGNAWRQELLAYLRGNRDRVSAVINALPGLRCTTPEATYLSWIDCRDLQQESPAAFFEAAGVGLSDGAAFGLPGYVRLNFGCPRSTLDEALARIRTAVASRG